MYQIIGADQREYGPVTADQLRQWIAEGRAGGGTMVRYQEGGWKPLSTFPEFAGDLARVTPPAFATAAAPPEAFGPVQHRLVVPAFVCSILGLFCCAPLFSTLALVFGAIAISQINQQPDRLTGKSLAIASMILALLGYAGLVAGIIFWPFLPEHFRDRFGG